MVCFYKLPKKLINLSTTTDKSILVLESHVYPEDVDVDVGLVTGEVHSKC